MPANYLQINKQHQNVGQFDILLYKLSIQTYRMHAVRKSLIFFTFVKPAEPNQQHQTKPIKLFSTYFVLIFTTNNNFVPCAILKKTVTLLP